MRRRRNISRELGWIPTKPWHTDMLTEAQKCKRVFFCNHHLTTCVTPEEFLETIMGWVWVSTDEKWWDITGPSPIKYRKARTKKLAKMQNQVNMIAIVCLLFLLCACYHVHSFISLCVCVVLQVRRYKSKKGGIKKRVCFWGGVSWHDKTRGYAWTSADVRSLHRHTKRICKGTLFEDDGVVFRADRDPQTDHS